MTYLITEHESLADAFNFGELSKKDGETLEQEQERKYAIQQKIEEGAKNTFVRTELPEHMDTLEKFRSVAESQMEMLGSAKRGRLIRISEGDKLRAVYSNWIFSGKFFGIRWSYRYKENNNFFWFNDDGFKTEIYKYMKETCGCLGFSMDCEETSSIVKIMVDHAASDERYFLHSEIPIPELNGWKTYRFKFNDII